MNWTAFLFVVASFLIGSFPTGYVLGKWLKGVDIRRVGSGNPGATNVLRNVGVGAGVATLVLDALKGWGPVWLSMRWFGGDAIPVLTGLAAVAGHTWSPFLGFKGGKGVATSAGVFAALLPLSTLLAVSAFGIALGVSRHVSVGSLTGAVVLPVVAFWSRGVTLPSLLALVLSILIIVRHIPNIRRLVRGEELQFTDSGQKGGKT